MRALVCRELSEDFSGVRVEDVDLPPPGEGHVQVEMRACAVNFPDVLMTSGGYQKKPPLPYIPGMEGAGIITALGQGVDGFEVGEEVMGGAGVGGMAEYQNIPTRALRKKPQNMSFEEAGSFRAAYLTAHVSLYRCGHVQPGETLLVHGAAGGVGMAAVDVGKMMGAIVIATASTEEKCEVLRARGADHVLNVTQGFREQVKELTDGRGADVIYDPVGGDVFDESTRCIAWGGRLLIIGFTSGRPAEVRSNLVLIKGFSVIGVRAGEYGRRNPELGKENMAQIDKWAREGKIKPYIGARVPLENAVDALALLRDRKAIGKVVVTMNDPVG